MDIKTFRDELFKNEILGGDFLTKDVFIRQWKLVLLIVGLFFFYISNRYTCLQKLSNINKLKTELADAKYESLTRSSELMTRTKQSQVRKMINERGVDLKSSNQPPFVISK